MEYTHKQLNEEVAEEMQRIYEERGYFELDSALSYKHWVLSKIKKWDRVEIDLDNYEYYITTFKLLC